MLLTRFEEFDQGAKLLSEFAHEGNDTPRVIEAMGIATLRMPLLPSEVPGARRELVMLAGRGDVLLVRTAARRPPRRRSRSS